MSTPSDPNPLPTGEPPQAPPTTGFGQPPIPSPSAGLGGPPPPDSYQTPPPSAGFGQMPPDLTKPAAGGPSMPGSFPPGGSTPLGGPWVPPGTELASVGRRIGGYFMEALLAIVTLWIGYVVWSLIVWGRGQTPGKQVLGMYCVRQETNERAGWGTMFLRFLGTVVESILFVVVIISAVMMIVSKDRKAIHDHIAGTIVVHKLT